MRRRTPVGEKITPQLEAVFLAMHDRKMQRSLNGEEKKKRKYHFFALAAMLTIVYGASAYSQQLNDETDIVIALEFWQIILIFFWILVSVVITSLVGNSKFIHLLYWCLVYWPLMAIMASALLYDEAGIRVRDWIYTSLVIAEIVTIIIFACVNYIYPQFIISKWFRETYGASRFWNIRLVDDWTMEYSGLLNKRYTCRYEGEFNADGLPHGRGIWSDDSYYGEILKGTWKDGMPIAPFTSRQYGGRGNSFISVRMAFFHASDDTFTANKLFPSNEMQPRVGVASVECSIAGEFYNDLPLATLLIEPQINGKGLTIGDCVRELGDSNSINEPLTTVQVNASDGRGIQVEGHIYDFTGSVFSRRAQRVVIEIKNAQLEHDKGDDEPKSSSIAPSPRPLLSAEGEENGLSGGRNSSNDSDIMWNNSSASESQSPMSLEIRDWSKSERKDAVVFFPGYNCWLKHSLEVFGQLCAMTNLSQRVYPIIYQWPGGQVPTYRWAEHASATKDNRKGVFDLLCGLEAEGIQNVHFVTHSLGVQSMMAAFEDSSDGSPSPVSECFRSVNNPDLFSSFIEGDKLVLKSITMLNADFPVNAFVEHGFRSIRRKTSIITLVGDRADFALFVSELINGGCNFFGSEQPSVLDSQIRKEQTGFHYQTAIGRAIDKLYFAPHFEPENDGVNLIFQGIPSVGSKKDEHPGSWLDLDVIDTTTLDTNVNNLRHAAFSVNTVLLRDIEEIIVTGRRAAKRTSLLHKEGNVFEYCQAPSFVVPK